jgi:hypothetical protein
MYNFSKDKIKEAIERTQSMNQAADFLGVNYKTFKRYAEKYDLFESNQSGKGIFKGVRYKKRSDVFKKNNKVPTSVLQIWLKRDRDWCCEECGLDSWRGNPISLEIDHIDGVNSNNEISNLKILCPNCHSQTPTWRGRNLKGKATNEIVSDEDFKKALLNNSNIRQALLSLGLAAKGANYNRAYSLLSEIDLSLIRET